LGVRQLIEARPEKAGSAQCFGGRTQGGAVRGYDKTSRRVHIRAWPGIIVVAAIVLACRPLYAQDPAGPDIPAAASTLQDRDPIDLAAHWVRVWQQGDVQWVLLSREASVLQGVEGLRASEALVRVSKVPAPNGTSSYTLDVYAEDVVRAGSGTAQRALRASFHTQSAVHLQAYAPKGLISLKTPPDRLALLARSGFAGTSPGHARGQTTQSSPVEVRTVKKPVAPALSPQEVVATPVADAATRTAPNTGMAPSTLPDFLPVPESRPSPTNAPAGQARAAPVVVPLAADESSAKVDASVSRAQFPSGGMDSTDDPVPVPVHEGGLPQAVETPALDSATPVPAIPRQPGSGARSTQLAPLPAPGTQDRSAPAESREGGAQSEQPLLPILPGSQRITRIAPRNGGPNFSYQRLPVKDGVDTVIIRGGVNLVTESPQFGIVDISADSVIIWRKIDEKGRAVTRGPNGEDIEDARQPMEVYLEGNVVVRQDERKVAGNGDQKTYRANSAFYDLLTERFIGLDAELDMFAPGLIAPARVTSPRIDQYRPFERLPNGNWSLGLPQIRAEKAVSTGSRFPNPGYHFNSRSVDITRVVTDQTDPITGRSVGDPRDPNAPQDLTWRIDARQNVFWMGSVPVFYWPRFVTDAEDFEPTLRQFNFRTNNYFGQQVLADFNGFRLIGIRKPTWIDIWNVDLDYLSARTKHWPALGSEIGWFGKDLINDLTDPYHQSKGAAPSFLHDYFGYFDVWGLQDSGRDTLGSGPAIITNNIAAGKAGFQRGGGGPLGGVPPFQDFRGRLAFRHMQRFIPDDDDHIYEDFRTQLEVGISSDRYFIEEYYKRLNDTGFDQETLTYTIRQKDNHAWTIWAEANLQSWQTETQWLPRLDYYRLGDSLLSNWFTYFQHTGVDYANTHTASEVNNPNIFAFMPYDPISNTSGVLKAGRAYTSHELDMPLNFFDNILRVVPYIQGQAVGWTNQIDGQSLGRVWGAVGARAEVMAWKAYPWVQSELLNVHGFNHKINLEADFRSAYSNVNLNTIGVQDDLDDNTYESVRRYLALTNYAGGILPAQYDPRFLILRRTLSPITGTTDIQATMETLHLGLHQRLQTKRGPEGRRRIIDYMTLDFDTTYFPAATRDNFGKPFGQNTYVWQWFIGDRTSIVSTGWFEFFKITGNPIFKTNIDRHNDPFGIDVVTTGISLSRPPRGNIFMGYSVINTGPINTSALTTSLSYWMSPKWYGTYMTMYDFGNAILLASVFSFTRVGADYLTTIGLTVDPQRQSYMFALQVSPRISPNMKLGQGPAMGNFDSRFAPTQ
jgi:hypothetical protein